MRRISGLVLAMSLVLFGFVTYVQFFQADALNADARNMRQLYNQYDRPRGSIIVDGQAIVSSVEVNDEYKYQRVYVDGEVYASVTGFYSIVNGSDRGIEVSENSNLSGASDLLGWERLKNILLGDRVEVASVELTLDSKIQKAAYEALKDTKGAAIVLDPMTGAVLASVSTPSYDPNLLASHDLTAASEAYQTIINDPANPMLNRAISELYPPGSTFKIIDTAAAFATGDYTSTSVIDSPKDYRLPGTDVYVPNAGGIVCGSGGKVTIKEALRLSCNTPFAGLSVKLGVNSMLDQARKFGVGSEITLNDNGTDAPIKAVASQIPQVMTDDRLALASIGQGDVQFTVLQDALLSMAIANSGTIMQPYLVRRVLNQEMIPIRESQPTTLLETMASTQAAEISDLMVNNVTNGYAYFAYIPGVEVGGKTGTAEKDENTVHSWFTGFAPADNPQYVIAVFVENADLNAGTLAAQILRVALGL
jgi:peptidoglycan glycosyltransferase